MQPPKDVSVMDGLKVNRSLEARSPASNSTHSTKHGDTKHWAARHSWLRVGTITSAAAGAVLPLAAEQAIAYQPAPAKTISPLQTAQTSSNAIADALEQGNAVLAQTSSVAQANFSPVSETTTRAQSDASPLIQQAEDGSWTLSAPAGSAAQSADTRSTLRTLTQEADTKAAQTVRRADQAASQATSQTASQCSGSRCKGLDYIDRQLPKARQQVKDAQAKLRDFEAAHAQQNMTAYQQVLANRLTEIIQQKSKLTIAIERTQQRVANLKQQLAGMDAEVGLAQRALDQSAEYQAQWEKLKLTEQNLLEEFSQAKINATALNEIYDDYEYNQQALQTVATEVLGAYLMTPDMVIPSFIQRVPDSLNVVQSLVTATHDQQVQLLRQETIANIEQKLKTRQSQLAGNVGEYEQLQRAEQAARQRVSQYEAERQTIAEQQPLQPRQAGSDLAIARARKLAPQLPKDSSAQAIIYTVLAAGAIATISAYRRSKQRAFVPALNLQPSHFHDPNLQKSGFQNGDLHKARFKNAGLANALTPDLQLAAAGPSIIQPTQYLSINKLLELNATASTLGLSSIGQLPVSPLEVKPMDVITAVNHAPVDHSQLDSSPIASTPIASTPIASAPIASLPIDRSPIDSEDVPTTIPFTRSLSLEEILAGKGQEEHLREQESSDAFEQRILAELQEITGQSVRLTEAPAELTGDSLEDSLSIEMMSRDLNEMLLDTTDSDNVDKERLDLDDKPIAIAPITLPLDNIDLFADQAIDWVIKDLGLSPMAAELDRAEREQAEAEREAIAAINEAVAAGEAIDIESLEIKRPVRVFSKMPAVEAMASV